MVYSNHCILMVCMYHYNYSTVHEPIFTGILILCIAKAATVPSSPMSQYLSTEQQEDEVSVLLATYTTVL